MSFKTNIKIVFSFCFLPMRKMQIPGRTSNHYFIQENVMYSKTICLIAIRGFKISSVQFSPSVVSDSLGCHGLQHTRPPYLSPTPRASSSSCPSSRRCHPTISSSVIPFSSCLLSFLASGSFPVSQFFSSGVQSIGASVSTSVLSFNILGRFPSELTGLISLLSKGLSRVFSNTTVQKDQFFGAQLSLQSNSHIYT